jgi:hypothetical protein
MARKPDGPLGWIRNQDIGKINAFYRSMEAYGSIPGWDQEMPSLDHKQPYKRLDHGYDETQQQLTLEDLQQAARFRGGSLQSDPWDGKMTTPLTWSCCNQHTFSMTPNSVLKGGHWCIECISPPWDYTEVMVNSKFVRQVLYPE